MSDEHTAAVHERKQAIDEEHQAKLERDVLEHELRIEQAALKRKEHFKKVAEHAHVLNEDAEEGHERHEALELAAEKEAFELEESLADFSKCRCSSHTGKEE